MKLQTSKLLFALLACSIIISFKQDNDFFEGKMISTNTFTDLEGKNIGKQLEPYLGKQVYYYINSKNYKGYNEKQQLSYLYKSANNTYYYFDLIKKSVTKYDVTIKSTISAEVTRLPNHETIAGYDCEGIQIKKDRMITTYFFSPKIKIDYKAFLNHEFGEWNVYLKATDGALPLKFTVKNLQAGYIWTSEATEVSKMKLTDKDFELPVQ